MLQEATHTRGQRSGMRNTGYAPSSVRWQYCNEYQMIVATFDRLVEVVVEEEAGVQEGPILAVSNNACLR